jgi:formylglycine-generating enzyme required for sulfatase activity
MSRIAFTSLFALIVSAGCSVWIDDFEIGTATELDPDQTGDSASTPETDSDPDGKTSCGVMFTLPNGGNIELCIVDVSSYRRGCDPDVPQENCGHDEGPPHTVKLTRFQMTRNEISRAQFSAFLAANPGWRKGGALADTECDTRYLNDWKTDSPPGGTEDLPVVQVCWTAAEAFCQWLGPGFGLPTEAQWEAAARGLHDGQAGAYWVYPMGNDITCALANYDTCGRQARPVTDAGGSSSLGFRSMAGNAWEWVSDWYRPDIYCDPEGLGYHVAPNCNTTYPWEDPQGDESGTTKVLRGGGFGTSSDELRCAARAQLSPNMTSDFSGLRCARKAP